MKLGKWIGGIMGFMAMGPLGALAGYAIGSLFDKAAYAPENMDAGNETYTDREIVFCSHCLSWLRTSFAQTEKSCIAKWNLYGGSCEQILAKTL